VTCKKRDSRREPWQGRKQGTRAGFQVAWGCGAANLREMFWRNPARDISWAEKCGGVRGAIGLTTFGILALELALIRWTSSQVRAFAYFNNVVLITAFLGMGIGVALGRRWPGLGHLTLPLLLLVSVPLGFAEDLHLVQLVFPDGAVALWGADPVPADGPIFLKNIAIFLGLLSGLGGVFVCAGAPLGHLFTRVPVLRAYGADLLGSLLGVVAFTAAAWLDAGPVAWLALGTVPFLVLSRRWWSAAALVGILGLGGYSVRGAIFSPYNRIDLTDDGFGLSLAVNRDFHQYLHDLSDVRRAAIAGDGQTAAIFDGLRQLYDLPFVVNPVRGRALVVGGGTGNDVQAARRNGYAAMTSVDIDARILGLGRERHPERPYADARVRVVNEDARAFFREDDSDRYDVVCFGLLDSHAMSSAMSTLRLDNYVYTEEGIRSAWLRVSERGHLSIAMSCAPGRWFFERLYWTITRATGREPIAVFTPIHGWVATFIVPAPGAVLDQRLLTARARIVPRGRTQLTLSDDWPFLYLRPAVFPWGYLAVLGTVLLVAVLVARPVFGFGRGGQRFDWALFFMGAAFLLIETRGVTSLSLLFGSTWIVNSAVFGGILTMVLLANLAVERWQWRDPMPWFAALFLAVLVLWWLPVEWLGALPLVARGVAGGLLTGLPIGIAGVIVPMLLARAEHPPTALGANLVGAVLGGCLEYLSIYAGLKSVALMALVLYLVAFLCARGARAVAHAVPAA